MLKSKVAQRCAGIIGRSKGATRQVSEK